MAGGRRRGDFWAVSLGLALITSAPAARCDSGAVSTDWGQVERVVVTAERTPRGFYVDGPGQLEIIDRERIRALPSVSAADVLAFSPGLRLQTRVQGEDAAVSIEGLPPEYTRLLVDGDHYAGELGAVGDLSNLPIANVGAIELLRGPQSLRYGSDAAGGVVNAVTRPAPSADGMRFGLESQLGQEGLIYASQASALRAGRWSGTLSATHAQTDGHEPRGSDAVVVGANEDSRRRIEDVYTTLGYDLDESTRLLARGGWQQDDEDQVFDAGSASRAYQRWLGRLGARLGIGEATQGELHVRNHRARTRSELGRSFRMDESEWVAQGHVEHHFALAGLEQRARLGFDVAMPMLDLAEGSLDEEALRLSQGLDEVDVESSAGRDERERFTQSGLYLEWEAEPADWLTFQAASRAVVHSAFADRVVGQVAVLLRPRDGVRLRLGWGTGYRTPSLRELYQPPVTQNGDGYFLAGNPELRPSRTTGTRIGLELDLVEGLSLAASAYWNEIDDHIRSALAGSVRMGSTFEPGDPDAAGCRFNPDRPRCQDRFVPQDRNLFRKTNLDHVRTRGAELRADWTATDWLRLRAGYTFTRTHVRSATTTADELPNEPRHTVDLESWLSIPALSTELTVRARWRDESIPEASGTGLVGFSDPGQLTDRSWVVDARLVHRLSPTAEVFIDGRNLTDQKTVDSYEIRGRRLIGGVRFDFEDLSW